MFIASTSIGALYAALSFFVALAAAFTLADRGGFDEAEDLYLIADNFGGFTRFGEVPDPKTACVLRIRAGEMAFDPGYRFLPAEVLGGLEPWGFYYAGQEVAYTTAVDPERLNQYPSVYEFIFERTHQGYTINVARQDRYTAGGAPGRRSGLRFSSPRAESFGFRAPRAASSSATSKTSIRHGIASEAPAARFDPRFPCPAT